MNNHEAKIAGLMFEIEDLYVKLSEKHRDLARTWMRYFNSSIEIMKKEKE